MVTAPVTSGSSAIDKQDATWASNGGTNPQDATASWADDSSWIADPPWAQAP
ncbi:hypothetical protein [Streptomyces sp. NPDC049040]|uniref:hypothetical protein n=1 Tax=Streptomyces sp. NPDC049040 TaxID=3365593 RepID=UPI0037238803